LGATWVRLTQHTSTEKERQMSGSFLLAITESSLF
jgi:hypothetical protein